MPSGIHATGLFVMSIFNPSNGSGYGQMDFPDKNFEPSPYPDKVPQTVLNTLSGSVNQQILQTDAQKFQEYMYTQYNSPEALKRQYEAAGINTNLLGSTSYGTAQGSSGAPAVNPPASPLGVLAEAANSIASAASFAADPALKASQTLVNMSLPSLNKALELKYGAETIFTDVQYQTANQLLDWSRQDRECNAMSLRLGYFQACQNYLNSKQEFENMVKEGKVLDSEAEWKSWEAKIKEESFNMLIQHHYLPDYSFLDRIYTDFIMNQDSDSFNKYVNGFTILQDEQNRSAARFGANGGNLRIGGFEVTPQMLEYIQQSGKDLYDVITDAKNGTDNTGLGSRIKEWFSKPKVSNDEPKISAKEERKFNNMDNVIRAVQASNPDMEMTAKNVTDILRDNGYGWSDIGAYLSYRQY